LPLQLNGHYTAIEAALSHLKGRMSEAHNQATIHSHDCAAAAIIVVLSTCMSALDDCCAASHTEADTPHDFKARYLLNIQQKWRQNQ
jgi:hypothetical protein